MNKSIHESKEICNRLRENNLMAAISEYALRYIVSILVTAFSCGNRGKTVDMARNNNRHRTSISRFLRYGEWDDSALEETMRRVVINKYQIRSAKGIKRFWLISSLAYLLACLESPSFDFSAGYASLSQKIRIEKILLFLTLPSMVGRSLPFWLWSLNYLLCIFTNVSLFCSFIVSINEHEKKCTKNKDKRNRERYNVIANNIYPRERLSYE